MILEGWSQEVAFSVGECLYKNEKKLMCDICLHIYVENFNYLVIHV